MKEQVQRYPHFHLLGVPISYLSIGVVIILTLSLACSLPGGADEMLAGTKVALDAQATQQSLQATSLMETALAGSLINVLETKESETTAPPPTSPPPTQPIIPTSTSEPLPTDTPQPTVEPPTPTFTSEPDLKAMMKSAKILLFEDVAGIYLSRYIKNALDQSDLPYVDVKDALGDFKAQILSGTDWDLIISASEARTGVKGEFFDYMLDELNRGTAVIIELYALDDIANGRISNILTQCGIKFSRDWFDPPVDERSIWWLVPEHPLFHEPNEGITLAHPSPYWFGDVGDLIRLIPGSNATLLAGTIATTKDSYGTLATCFDGRLIIQTFSSHDYKTEDMTRLWQNYIYYTLKNHFEKRE